MFSYTPVTEQEATEARFNLLKEGIYDAVIASSEDKVSASSGNPMMDMTLQVFDENGKPSDVRDFMVFTKSMMWKVINFAKSANLLKEYEEGKLCSDIVRNHRVKVKVNIESGSLIPADKLNGKPAGSKYPDKNKIEDYLVNENKKPVQLNVEGEPLLDDDIPFN